MEDKMTKKEKIDHDQVIDYPINHRIRPEGMCIMEASKIGQSYLKKNPDYETYIEYVRNFEKTDGE